MPNAIEYFDADGYPKGARTERSSKKKNTAKKGGALSTELQGHAGPAQSSDTRTTEALVSTTQYSSENNQGETHMNTTTNENTTSNVPPVVEATNSFADTVGAASDLHDAIARCAAAERAAKEKVAEAEAVIASAPGWKTRAAYVLGGAIGGTLVTLGVKRFFFKTPVAPTV
jgi:hypothetical protein